MNREEIQDKLLKSYEAYYDIEKYDCENEVPLIAKCTFSVHSMKYVLVKSAVLWSADSNEHVFIFSTEYLTKALYEKCRDYAYEKGMALIDPKPGHMYTYITTIFLCDECDMDARKALKRCRIHKNFHFSLYGWMDFHTALVISDRTETNKDCIVTNGSGHENAKIIKKILYVSKKGR